MDGLIGTQLASDPFGETFAVAGRGGREVRFRRLACAFVALDGFADLLLSQRDPILALRHPNIVTTAAIARDGKGRLFVGERLPSGSSLASCLEVATRSGIAPDRDLVLHVAHEVVSGLAHLHGAGLVHGLIHPRSVYIDPDGVVRLGDLAVAHAVAVSIGEAAELRWLAQDGLAPDSGSGPVDGRLDVYRTGAVIRLLLSAAEDGDLPGPLAEVIERATASDPRERHADGAELLVHLGEAIDADGDVALHQRDLARLVADALAAASAAEVSGANAEAAEIAREVDRLATADGAATDASAARPAAPTVERPSLSARKARLVGRLRSLRRPALLLVAAELLIAALLGFGLMSNPDPAPARATASPAPTTAIPPSPPPHAPADLAVAAPPAPCVLSIRSNPPAATVVIDGLSAGITPLAVVGAPCHAPVQVTVEKVGYEDWRKELQLVSGESVHLQATLRRRQMMLRVASSPAGAQVEINGKPVGKTPLTVEVNAFANAGVLLHLKGFRPYRATVVPAGQKEIVAQLVPLRRPAGTTGRTPGAASVARSPRSPAASVSKARRR